MDSNTVIRSIRKSIIPLLKENEFSVFTSRSAWRYRENTINVINFQSFNSYLASIVECTTFSFAVNLGVYIRCIPWIQSSQTNERSNQPRPEEYACHIRRRLRKSVIQPKKIPQDIWRIDENGDNLEEMIADARSAIESEAFAWFERFEDLDEVLRTVINDEEDMNGTTGFGRPDCFVRKHIIGYVSLEKGNYRLAASSFKNMLDSGLNHSLQLESDYRLALNKANM